MRTRTFGDGMGGDTHPIGMARPSGEKLKIIGQGGVMDVDDVPEVGPIDHLALKSLEESSAA
ncbi:hypothetical protein [Streptomyces sp. NPDC058664]|uniref:hypothetical protein n=1 Tax=unclassified Streptomyces TaxID=2593676 RepID=UPI003656904D